MIRLIALFFILAGSCFAVTPVKDIRLQGTADGGGVLFTNLSDIVTTNGAKLSEVLTVSALANTVTNAGTRVNGSPLTNGAALLVGTVREIVGTNGVMVSQGSGPITIISAAAMLTNATGAGRLTLGISGQTVTGAVDVSGLATGAPIYSLAGYATGTPIYTTAGLATGTPLYVESDPVFVAASNALLTKAQAALIYATGTPVYAVSGLATGTPIYSVAGLATGTPIYSLAGYATGTPLYVESYTGSVGSLSGYMPSAAVTTAITALSFPLASGQNLSGRVAAVEGAGYVTSASGWSGHIATQDVDMAGNRLENVIKITSAGAYSIDFEDGSVAGVMTFLSTPVIPGYLATNGTYNLSLGYNAPAAWTNQPSLLALSNAIVTAGASATNFGLAIGAGATALVTQASAAGTNFALAVGAGNSNLTLSAWATASNGLTTARAAQVQASNINAGAWSQVATAAVNMANSPVTNAAYIAFGTNTLSGTETNAIGINSGSPGWMKAPGSFRVFANSENLSSLGIQTTAGFNSSITNYARITPTGYTFPSAWNDSVGQNGDLVRSGTNMAFKSAGVWVRWQVSTNW